jgi:uncharacterized protein
MPDSPRFASSLSQVAMQRYDTVTHRWRDSPGSAEAARALIDAGAAVDGAADDLETPLITAASYGDADVARVLIEAGADVEARASDRSGGVPGGTALLHSAVFGMTAVVELLIAGGAQVRSIEEAAAAGNLAGWLRGATSEARLRALIMAADHERLNVIDELIASGVPVDAVDLEFGRHPLRLAAANGRAASVRRLLEHGADPNLRDGHGRTPLDACRASAVRDSTRAHAEVESILAPLTTNE